jgi:hypothetical protein
VTGIGSMAFFDCDKLSSVIIPASVESIGYGAFDQCEMLSEITIDRTEAPKISFSTFGTNKNTKIFVPAGSVSYDTGYWANYTVVYRSSASVEIPKGAKGYESGNWSEYTIIYK